MNFGRAIPSMFKSKMNEPRKLGQFYMVMRIDGVISIADFIESMQQMTDEVRAEPAIDGESVMLPGDPQMICAKKRMKDGIPLDDSTLDVLVTMSKKNNVILKLI